MRPKSLILLILALGCGLVAAIGINQVMANRASQNNAQAGETTPIFVALTDIGMGDPLTPEVLKLEEWPKGKVPPGALERLEEIEGRRTKTRFYVGEPIIEAKLFGQGDAGGAATDLIPKGFRVVSVKVDTNSGSGLILPGDRVDVLVHLQEQPGRQIDSSGTKTFLQNIKVFAVNDVFAREGGDEQSITAKTISLLVTPQQANLVTMANEMGKIRLVMRSPGDESIEETEGVTPSDIFRSQTKGTQTASASGGGMPNGADLLKLLSKPPVAAPAPPQPVAAAPVAAVAQPWKMILIEGNGVREVEFTAAGQPTSYQQDSTSTGSSTGPAQSPADNVPSLGTPADPPAAGEPTPDEGPTTTLHLE